ncbi:MAG: hypothetical protein NC097_05460 [Clostridium sp.]|nr:ATPase [Prevotella sp.]MCM1429224.1 hypothetical protein [Clostridium sp.]MCM1475743.1 ATPase [Muribaculaceae bacterium]
MNDLILIVDAGSTKIDWAVIDGGGTLRASHSSEGINALLAEEADIINAFSDVRKQLSPFDSFSEIHYYGAGCATTRVCSKMRDILGNIWVSDKIHVESDLLAAARALFGHKPGIACILGTGSNSCLYDGERIVDNIPSLGYVLGDEGSGSALGKRLVADAFKHQLPDKICQDFMNEYNLTVDQILEKVYRSAAPNSFLASLVSFIDKTLWNPYIYSLVLEEFKRFISRNVAMYKGSHSLPVSFMGGIAVGFENILREAAGMLGFEIADVVKSPKEGLIRYHS